MLTNFSYISQVCDCASAGDRGGDEGEVDLAPLAFCGGSDSGSWLRVVFEVGEPASTFTDDSCDPSMVGVV